MPERRAVLPSCLACLSALAAGCSSVPSTDSEPANSRNGWHEEPVRGGAASVSVDRSLENTDPASDEEFESACLWAAYDHLRAVLDEDLDADRVAFGVSSSIEADERVLVVERVALVDRSGGVEAPPDAGFEAVRTATPAGVHATVDDDGTERSLRVPVYVRDATLRVD